jgi:hypothetical protein
MVLSYLTRIQISVADPDPGSSAFLTPGSGSGIRDPESGMEKKFFDADPDPVSFRPWIRDLG